MAEKIRNLFRVEVKRSGFRHGSDGVSKPHSWWETPKIMEGVVYPTKREALAAGDLLVEQRPHYLGVRVIQERWPAALTFSEKANHLIKSLFATSGDEAANGEWLDALNAEFKASPALWAEFRERAIPLLEKSLERLKKLEVFDD